MGWNPRRYRLSTAVRVGATLDQNLGWWWHHVLCAGSYHLQVRSCYSFLSNLMPLVILSTTCSIMFTRSSLSTCILLFVILGERIHSSSLSMILPTGFSQMPFTMIKEIPFQLQFVECFLLNKRVLDFVKYFFYTCRKDDVELIMFSFSFILLTQCIIFIGFQILKQPCISQINPSWSCHIILCVCVTRLGLLIF